MINRFICVLAVSLFPFLHAAESVDNSIRPAELPVRILDGSFVDGGGKSFLPHGFNYIRLFPERSHNTFDPQHYDSAAADRSLKRWQADGFNVVRVFLNSAASLTGSMTKQGEIGLTKNYVENVADFLVRARSHGIGVMLCAESFPRVLPYSDGLGSLQTGIAAANAEYLDAAHVRAKAQFFKDLIRELKSARPGSLDAVFSYDVQNELCFSLSEPFTLETGEVVAANGKTYQIPTQLQELADDSAVFFVDQMVEAIHAEHPTGLVSASVFSYAAVGRNGPGDFQKKDADWQNRLPFRPVALLRSKANFIDLHFYAADAESLAVDLKSLEFDSLRTQALAVKKPLFVGEFGAFKSQFREIGSAADWMAKLPAKFDELGFAGWLYWTYDTDEQTELWNACENESLIYRSLVAAKRPVK